MTIAGAFCIASYPRSLPAPRLPPQRPNRPPRNIGARLAKGFAFGVGRRVSISDFWENRRVRARDMDEVIELKVAGDCWPEPRLAGDEEGRDTSLPFFFAKAAP